MLHIFLKKLSKGVIKSFYVLLFIFVCFLILDKLFPLPIKDFKQRHFAQIVVDKAGHPLRAFADKQGVWRYEVSLDEISPLYLQALINYEDRYFYYHFGINPFAIARALGQWIINGKIISGASTLTMQVARILKPHKKSFSGKLVQMFMALQLEWHYNKQEILTYYVNYAPFGGPLEGVQAASYAYLGKPAIELSESEAALLAVMPQSPSRFRPDKHPKRAQKARNKLLGRLKTYAIWDKQVIQEAMNEPIFAQYNTRPMIAPLLSQRLKQNHPKSRVIQTTIDIELQSELENLVKDYIENKPEKMSAALLLINNKDLSTVAYIGSADFQNNKRAGQVDMIQAKRSPGSTLKPFIYGLAIDAGIVHSQSLLFDVPQSFSGYRPKNFSSSFSGPASLTQALGRSLNMPAVQILNAINPTNFYAKMQSAGLNIQLPINAKPNLSLALGGGSANLENMVGVFSSLGRKGKSAHVRLTKDEPLISYPLLSQGSAWIIQNILANVPLQGKLHSQSLMPQQRIAYKTGTSYGGRDAWVLASNAQFTIGIWLGQPDGSFVDKNTGRNSAVPLLRKVLTLLPIKWDKNPEQPLNVVLSTICWPLGTKLSLQKKEYCHKKYHTYLLEDNAPPTLKDILSTKYSSGLTTVLLDAKTQKRVLPTCLPENVIQKQYALWPRVLEPWLAKPLRREKILPKFSKNCHALQTNSQLRLSGIHNNATLYPEVGSQNMPDVQINLEGSIGKVYWFVNGKLLQENTKKLNLEGLTQGKYHVTVIDDSGNFAEISFEVAIPTLLHQQKF